MDDFLIIVKIQVAKIIAGADERFLAKWWLNLLITWKKWVAKPNVVGGEKKSPNR